MTLLTASNTLYDTVIEEVFGKDVDRDGYEWREVSKKLWNDVKSYKHRVIMRVIVSVSPVIKTETYLMMSRSTYGV